MNNHVKYPRTVHLPWSPGASEDDIVLTADENFHGKIVVVTEKMDGENTSLYHNGYHARSLNHSPHPSQDYVKKLWGEIKHELPEDFRICGENLFAKHSIHYQSLLSYFMVFSIWEKDRCFSWDETEEYAKMLGLHTVPVLYKGLYDEKIIKALWSLESHFKTKDANETEGYVVRVADSFHYDDFSKNIAKFVRKDHVTTDQHWKLQAVVPNKLGETK